VGRKNGYENQEPCRKPPIEKSTRSAATGEGTAARRLNKKKCWKPRQPGKARWIENHGPVNGGGTSASQRSTGYSGWREAPKPSSDHLSAHTSFLKFPLTTPSMRDPLDHATLQGPAQAPVRTVSYNKNRPGLNASSIRSSTTTVIQRAPCTRRGGTGGLRSAAHRTFGRSGPGGKIYRSNSWARQEKPGGGGGGWGSQFRRYTKAGARSSRKAEAKNRSTPPRPPTAALKSIGRYFKIRRQKR